MKTSSKKHSSNKRVLVVIASLVSYISLMAAIIIFVSSAGTTNTSVAASLDGFAKKILKECEDEKYRPGCYDREIPLLMKRISMEEAFAVANIVQRNDGSYGYCHALGHKLASIEQAKNPSDWKQTLRRCPVGTCSNGCQHGVLQEKYRAESLTDKQIEAIIPDLQNVCHLENANGLPTDYVIANCYHGLGHMTLFMTKANMEKALALCGDISTKPDGNDYTKLCYDGLFMQLFQTTEPEDIALVKDIGIVKENVMAYCKNLPTPLSQEVCWLQAWYYFKDEIQHLEGIQKFCSNDLTVNKDSCYDTVFHGVAQVTQFDQKKAVDLCNSLPDDIASPCYKANISAMFNAEKTLIPQAVSLCKATKNTTVQESCYENVLQHAAFNYHKQSAEYQKACGLLPEKWRTLCLENNE